MFLIPSFFIPKIIRFVSEECIDNEQKELLAWINQSSENKKVYLEIKDIFDSSRFVKDFGNEQLILFYKNKYKKSRKSRNLFLQWSIPFAAIFLVGLIISLLSPIKSAYQHEKLIRVMPGEKFLLDRNARHYNDFSYKLSQNKFQGIYNCYKFINIIMKVWQ